MMRAQLKCRNQDERENEPKKTESCAIVICVHTASGPENVLTLAGSGSLATLANKQLVSGYTSNTRENIVKLTIQGGI